MCRHNRRKQLFILNCWLCDKVSHGAWDVQITKYDVLNDSGIWIIIFFLPCSMCAMMLLLLFLLLSLLDNPRQTVPSKRRRTNIANIHFSTTHIYSRPHHHFGCQICVLFAFEHSKYIIFCNLHVSFNFFPPVLSNFSVWVCVKTIKNTFFSAILFLWVAKWLWFDLLTMATWMKKNNNNEIEKNEFCWLLSWLTQI